MNLYKNILLINFGGIGDEILFLPVLQSLKRQYPSAKITLCLEGRSKAFLNLTNLVNDYFCVDIKTKNKYIEMLKLYFKALFGHYDLVISAGSNPLISVLLYFTGINTRVGYSVSKASEKLLTYPVKLNKQQYAAKMYFDLVKPICDIEFELPYIDVTVEKKLDNSVLIHPGVSAISVSKKITKTISPEKWAELIKLLLRNGKKVYLAGGPDDKECIEIIRKSLSNVELDNFYDMYGKTKNIYELATLIKQSEVLICSDSAPMHIGVATNTKTVAIFGPTHNELLLPDSDMFVAVKNDVPCRPCLWDKRLTTCNELKCLNINLDNVINNI
ncbi:glycosyltransferase family 9 protein [bacterium]|nr:glycosyltransferase family 9 protein [bacterium]